MRRVYYNINPEKPQAVGIIDVFIFSCEQFLRIQFLAFCDSFYRVSHEEGDIKTYRGMYENMISISDKARKMLQHQGLEGDAFVRILVKTGGCAGMTYEAEIAEIMWDGETIACHENGVTVVSDKESLPYLDGLEIDYSDDLISVGYRFRNDNNETACGCGASFALAGFPVIENGGARCDH